MQQNGIDLGLCKSRNFTTKNTKSTKKRYEIGLIFETFVFFVVKKLSDA
jgi:hypothetical protein